MFALTRSHGEFNPRGREPARRFPQNVDYFESDSSSRSRLSSTASTAASSARARDGSARGHDRSQKIRRALDRAAKLAGQLMQVRAASDREVRSAGQCEFEERPVVRIASSRSGRWRRGDAYRRAPRQIVSEQVVLLGRGELDPRVG